MLGVYLFNSAQETGMRKLASFFIAATLAIGGVIGLTGAANAATWGIDMTDVCHLEVDPLAYPIHGSTAVSWLCHLGATNYRMDLNLYCDYKHGTGTLAAYSDFNNPYSWYCYN
jgi:hypothetical protein